MSEPKKLGCGALSFPLAVLAIGLVLGWKEFVGGVVRMLEAWHG